MIKQNVYALLFKIRRPMQTGFMKLQKRFAEGGFNETIIENYRRTNRTTDV